MTKEKMIQEVREIAEILGKTPTRAEFITLSETGWCYVNYWIGYNEFLEEAGLQPVKHVKHGEAPEKEDVIACFQEIWHLHGKQPTSNQFRSTYLKESYYINALFGSFNGLVVAAGGKPRKVYNSLHKPRAPWTREEILALAKKDVEEGSLPATGTRFTKKHHIGYQFLKNHFGTYEDLLAAVQEPVAGIHPVPVLQHVKPETRKPMPIRIDWTKRYPVRYKSAPASLKWYRRRQEVL